MFKMLGMLVTGYVAYGFATGEIYCKHRSWGRTFRRDEQPWEYWGAMISYALLGIALVFFFRPRGRQ